MLTDFWKSMGGKLGERGLAALFSPVLLFWVVGAFAMGLPYIRQEGLGAATRRWGDGFQHLPVAVQGGLVIGLLLVVALSGLLLEQLATPVLVLLEGYWPGPLAAVRRRLAQRLSLRADKDKSELRQLLGNPVPSPSDVIRSEHLTAALLRVPTVPQRRMPTRVGNVISAAECRPDDRYGLNAVTTWPALWLVIPDETRQEVIRARASLNLAVQVWIVGLATIVWTFLAWWSLPLGIVVCTATYYLRVIPAAYEYGSMIIATYHVHRPLLYAALRWPLPENPKLERASGWRLTAYLAAGSLQTSPLFTPRP
ncbi:hypothetical protein GCM10009665_59040 [Kitasatospora nipponensis]|uniref:Uncharacterized protein n=1 Tax=Kitasatospora nipponensis TaxID=258049 RepID=A0ABN1WRE2_9ACTN